MYHQRNITAVNSLLLNYQPNYNSNRQSLSQGVINQLMFAQLGETGDGEGEKNRVNKKPAMIVEKKFTMQ